MRLRPASRRIAAAGLALVAAWLAAPSPSVAAEQDVSRCRSGELKAAAAFCKVELGCWAKFAQRPERDPTGAARDACRDKGFDRFAKGWEKSVLGALRKGDTCGFDAVPWDENRDPADFVNDTLLDPLESLRDTHLLAGWDASGTTKDESALRAGLLKAAGDLCSKLLAAESAHVKKPDAARLASARTKARERYDKGIQKALDRAASRGVPDPGLDAAAARAEVEALVAGFVDLTAPMLVDLSGVITGAPAHFADSDVNNPFTDSFGTFDRNDSFFEAQEIPAVPATIGGYVTLPGRGPAGPSSAFGDTADVFHAPLAAGQQVVLLLGEDPNKVDLDLCLYWFTTGTLVGCSLGLGAVEQLTVPETATYFIEVFPFEGCRCGSTYVLTLGQPPPATASGEGAGTLHLGDEFVPGEVLVRLREPDAGERVASAAAARDRAAALGFALRAGALGREMLWALPEGEAGAAQSLRTLGAAGARDAMRERLRGTDTETQRKVDTLLAVKALAARPDVAAVQPNYVRRPAFRPNDEFFPFQWHYGTINLEPAWDVTRGDPDVVVAVLDTGILPDHPDLQGQLVPGYDFVSDRANAGDRNGIDDDPTDPGDGAAGGRSSFHGTHVAGTVAASTDNGEGVAGVAPDARIMPVRVLGRFGGTSFDLVQGIRFAAGLPNDSGRVPDAPADVVNMSLGGTGFGQLEQDAMNAAHAAGVVLVAAAGNQASSVPFYPASYANVISVAAVDLERQRAPYSNFGPDVDVAAPGGTTVTDRDGDGFVDGVLSTLADDSGSSLRFNYVYYQGTSMAAPHVAGVVALMKAVDPTLTPPQIDTLLASGALTRDLGAPGRDDLFGHGLIDARRAVVAASGDPLDATLVASPTALSFGVALGELTFFAENGGEGALTLNGITVEYTPGDPTGWLTVAPVDVDGDGLGEYRASVDRSGLDPGTYRATILLDSSLNDVRISVLMSVGAAAAPDVGVQFVLLIDPATFELVDFLPLAPRPDGTYLFSFPDVIGAKEGNFFAGSYVLVSGTDNDNDGFICDDGEACGAYPDLDLIRPQPFPESTTELDFDVGFLAAIPTLQSAGAGKRGLRLPPIRIPKLRDAGRGGPLAPPARAPKQLPGKRPRSVLR